MSTQHRIRTLTAARDRPDFLHGHIKSIVYCLTTPTESFVDPMIETVISFFIRDSGVLRPRSRLKYTKR